MASKKTAVLNTVLGKGELRVRMYRVGFGDCFLISFPVDDGHSHVLVDFGVHAQGNIGTLDRVMNDLEAVTAKNLSLVIATHVHQDHISGFGEFAGRFSSFTVREVWLPWTEDPQDQEASRLRKKHTKLHAQIRQFYDGSTAARKPSSTVDNILLNLAPNSKAMQVLRSGFLGNPKVRYLAAGKSFKVAGGIDGLTIKVLGPPQDPQFISKMDPPKDDRYLRVVNEARGASGLKPFLEHFQVHRDNFDNTFPDLKLDQQAIDKLKNLAEESPESLAFSLDHAMNNTSLVTLFAFGQERLLFPGDAQYGNWQWWTQLPDADEILSQISFLKVAHHGSVNATPKNVLERMGTPTGLSAMVSTQSKPWPSIPKKELMTALDKCTGGKVVQSDSIQVAAIASGAPKGPASNLNVGHFRQGPFWVDYIVKP